MQSIIKPGLFRHYKGPLYKVIELATHSETEDRFVVYQALYGDKGIWVRPETMFSEMVMIDGKQVPRFQRLEEQTMVREIAVLEVIRDKNSQFLEAFSIAERIITSMPGHISHRLEPCVEQDNKYLLSVLWQTLEDHEIGFRGSAEYQEWKNLLHHFYDPFPVVEHYWVAEQHL